MKVSLVFKCFAIFSLIPFFLFSCQGWNELDGRLCQAILSSDIQNVENIMRNFRVDPNKFDNNGVNVFLAALLNGSCKLIEILITYGARVVHIYPKSTTALHIVTRMNHCAALKLLVDHLKSEELFLINVQDSEYNSPLHYAVINENVEAVQILLEYGANIYITNNQKNLPLHLAASRENYHIIKLLLQKKLISWYELAGIELRKPVISISQANYVNQRNASGSTPLHYAVVRSSIRIVNELLEAGADLFLEDNLGRTAITITRFYNRLVMEQFLSNYALANKIMQYNS